MIVGENPKGNELVVRTMNKHNGISKKFYNNKRRTNKTKQGDENNMVEKTLKFQNQNSKSEIK